MLSFFLSVCDTEDQQLTFIDLFFLKFESSLSWVRLELFDEKKNQKSHDIVSLTLEKQRYGLWIWLSTFYVPFKMYQTIITVWNIIYK